LGEVENMGFIVYKNQEAKFTKVCNQLKLRHQHTQFTHSYLYNRSNLGKKRLCKLLAVNSVFAAFFTLHIFRS
jgi:hypothetical protein